MGEDALRSIPRFTPTLVGTMKRSIGLDDLGEQRGVPQMRRGTEVGRFHALEPLSEIALDREALIGEEWKSTIPVACRFGEFVQRSAGSAVEILTPPIRQRTAGLPRALQLVREPSIAVACGHACSNSSASMMSSLRRAAYTYAALLPTTAW